jgi:signal transduction histidine kinase
MFVLLAGLLPVPSCISAKDPVARSLDLPDSPEELPYKLKQIGHVQLHNYFVSNVCPDLNGDSLSESLRMFSDPIGQSYFRSAVVGHADALQNECLFQYNGPYRNSLIWTVTCLDLMGNVGDEIVMTKHSADTILLEIVSFDGSFDSIVTKVIPAAIGLGLRPGEAWHNVTVGPLEAFDVSGDGVKDLIYIRSAKPDSAFERGVVAYDLVNDKQLWFFRTADCTGRPNFHQFRRSADSVCFVFTTAASQNAYESNGMDSYHSYTLSIRPDGRELWRKTTGFGFGGTACVPFDVNGDGIDEECVGVEDASDSSSSTFSLQCMDPFTGNVVAKSAPMQFAGYELVRWKVSESPARYVLFMRLVQGTATTLYTFGGQLRITSEITGISHVYREGIDVTGDGLPDVIVATDDGRMAILEAVDLTPIAFVWSKGNAQLHRGADKTSLLIVGADGSYDAFELERQPLLLMLYARYKWYLAVLLSGVLTILLYRAGRWIYGLYLASAGLPTLQSINAGVIVLNRRGKVGYFNSNPLVSALFGSGLKRSGHFSKTSAAGNQRLNETIRRSYDDPYVPVQERHSIDGNGRSVKIDLTIVPRVDSRNRFLGKIIIAEDVTGRVGFERKVVFGEAAQRWLHKLKGAMATAKIRLDNVLEDPRTGETVHSNEALGRSLFSIKGQLEDTSVTADKILSFCAISKPELMLCDLNSVVTSTVRPYVESPPKGITVAEKLQPDLPTVMIDPEQIAEVVENLLSNAVDAIEGAGSVTVATRLADDLLKEQGGGSVEIAVSDSGRGIAEDDLPRIFDPGFTRSRNGTGVGLAIVREIIENHNGSILVESKKGEGSRFTVRIPFEGCSRARRTD